MTIQWDLDILAPGGLSVDLAGTAIEAPRASSGLTGAIDFSGGGFWAVEMRKIGVIERSSHLLYQRYRNHLNGGVRTILVPILNDFAAAQPDGMRAILGGVADTAAIGTVAADAALAAGTIAITLPAGGVLVGGETFSIQHPTKDWHAYSIGDIDSVTTTSEVSTYTVGIRPPLREAVTAGAVANFFRPLCLMRLRPGTTMPWEPEDWWNFRPTVQLVEKL